MEKKKEDLTKENISSKERVDDFTNVVHKFTLVRKKILDMMISKQRCIFNKKRLGFKPTLKYNFLINHFIKASNTSHIICHYCNAYGHISFDCHIKKNMNLSSKYKRIKKYTSTNTIGLKLV